MNMPPIPFTGTSLIAMHFEGVTRALCLEHFGSTHACCIPNDEKIDVWAWRLDSYSWDKSNSHLMNVGFIHNPKMMVILFKILIWLLV